MKEEYMNPEQTTIINIGLDNNNQVNVNCNFEALMVAEKTELMFAILGIITNIQLQLNMFIAAMENEEEECNNEEGL